MLAHGSSAPAAAACIAVHFAKRVLECLFLHKYSGTIGVGLSGTIGTYYALCSLMIALSANDAPSAAVRPVALALFALGEMGNLYHHWLLAGLRSGASATTSVTTTGYSPPSGGLFEYVAAPHYLFEIVAWWGIALCAQQTNALLVAASMTSYLSGRAVAQNRWNRQKFGESWPATRKSMIPFAF